MDAVIGWVVIAGVVYMAFRAIRKWRREWKQGLTSVTTAVEAAATAVAHADAGGVHLHLSIGATTHNALADGSGSDAGYTDAQIIDVPSAEAHDVQELAAQIAAAIERARTVAPVATAIEAAPVVAS